MKTISRAKLIDDLVQMYEITGYEQLTTIHKIIDEIVGKGNDVISVVESGKIMAKTDKLFKMRK